MSSSVSRSSILQARESLESMSYRLGHGDSCYVTFSEKSAALEITRKKIMPYSLVLKKVYEATKNSIELLKSCQRLHSSRLIPLLDRITCIHNRYQKCISEKSDRAVKIRLFNIIAWVVHFFSFGKSSFENPYNQTTNQFCNLQKLLRSELDAAKKFEELAGINSYKLPSESEIAFPNYETAKLVEIQKQMDERNIPLVVCPERPSQNYPIDQDLAQKYIEGQLDPIRKEVIRKAVTQTQHISMQDFDEALKECVKQFNEALAQQADKAYAVGAVWGKSNQWVASLALKDLEVLPTSAFSLGAQGSLTAQEPKQEFDISHIKEDNVVLFDDCSYSGRQIYDNVVKVHNAFQEKGRRVNLFVVIPFMTTQAKEGLARLTEHVELKVITTNKNILTVKEIFPIKKELHVFLDHMNTGYDDWRMTQKTLCYTDWRFPDGTSFFNHWGHCKIDVKWPNGRCFVQEILGRFIPLDIPRPYEI